MRNVALFSLKIEDYIPYKCQAIVLIKKKRVYGSHWISSF